MSQHDFKNKMIYNIIDEVEASIYWKDKNGYYLGCNKYMLKMAGLSNIEEIIGKRDDELPWRNIADRLVEIDNLVVKNGRFAGEETPSVYNKQQRIFYTTKAQLLNDDDEIMGVVGTSIDITDRKEKERLQLENERHKIILEEQEKFRKVIGQIVHDIQSPLSSLQTIVQAAANIPENERVNLRNVAMSITDITTQMLNTYQDNLKPKNEQKQSLLLSANLLQILSEKRYEYKNTAVEFTHDFEDNSYFTFIKIEPSNFKRMVSNTINNAVDAVKDKKDGKVTIKLYLSNEWVTVSIEDNGKGMSKEILDKINNKIAVTSDKENGHGIGLTQVRDTLEANYGKVVIESTVGIGTNVKLKFPKTVAPSWIAQKIKIFKDDIVVILDDDNSIHGAWDTRLTNILNESPNIQVKHFIDGVEAINFINSFPNIEKQKILLLSDYELLKQEVNGLDVIKQTQIKRSTLVTSYYNDSEIRNTANKDNIKILPKSLVFAVPVNLSTVISPHSRKVDMVWVDDAKELLDTFIECYYKHLTIDKYSDPILFLDTYRQYPLDTKIILDMFYYDDIIFIKDGITIAKELHESGYTNLFIATAEIVPQDKIPDYLTVILKNDSQNMSQLHLLKSKYKIFEEEGIKQSQKKAVDLILIDDNKVFINTLLSYTFQNMQVDTYFKPEELLENIYQYDRNIKIAIDNHFSNSNITGNELAKKLYNQGFTNLYILSGNQLEDIYCTDYVTAITKADIASIKEHLAKIII